MSKKIFVLFLSIFVMLFACSSAMAFNYQLAASADNEIDDVNIDAIEYEEYANKDNYAGYNYKTIISLPKLYLWVEDEDSETWVELSKVNSTSYDIAWKLSTDVDNLTTSLGTDTSGDTIIITGVVPTADFSYSVIAEVTSVSNSDHSAAEGTSLDVGKFDISVYTDDYHTAVMTTASSDFKTYVNYDTATLTEVSSDYSITVNASTNALSNNYKDSIQSSDSEPYYSIDLPEWLYVSDVTYATSDDYASGVDWTYFTSDSGGLPITSITLKYKSGTNVQSGDKGTVHIPFYSVTADDISDAHVITWDVTYTAAEKEEEESHPFGISGDKEVSFSFTEAGTSKSQTLTYTGSVSVVSYDLSGDLTAFTTEITSTDLSTDTYTGTITVKITTPSTITTLNTEYEGSIIFWDADGVSDDVTVKITVDITGASFEITPSTTSFTLAPGESKDVTITASNAVSSSSWSVTSKSDDISVDITVSGDYIAVATVTAHEDAAEGENSVTITATDNSGNSKTATLTVTISSSSESEDAGFSITADPASLDLHPDSTDTVIVTAVNGLVVSWDVSADEGITCEIVTSSDEEAEIDLTVDEDAEDGSYTVIVLAENTSGDTKTATITVTVSSSDSGETSDTITLTPERTSVSMPVGEIRSIGLTATNFSGASSDISWTHSSATSYFSVNVRSNGSSAVADITASAVGSGTATVTATDKAGNSASVSITVTVISGDSGSGGGGSTTGQRTTATATQISDEVFNKQSVKNLLNSKLGSHNLFKMNVANTVANLSATYKYNGNVISLPMPPSSDITSAGIYICALSYSDFSKVFSDDTPLYLYRTRKEADGSSITVSSVEAAADDSDTLALFDDNGNAISTLSADTSINFAAYLTPSADYEAVATDTLVSSSTDVSGDSKLRAANVGCNAGFGSLFGMLTVMFTASALYLRRKDN